MEKAMVAGRPIVVGREKLNLVSCIIPSTFQVLNHRFVINRAFIECDKDLLRFALNTRT